MDSSHDVYFQLMMVGAAPFTHKHARRSRLMAEPESEIDAKVVLPFHRQVRP